MTEARKASGGGSRIWRLNRLLLVVCLVTAVWAAGRRAHALVAARAERRVDARAVRVIAPAPWLTRADLIGIRDDAGLADRRFSYRRPGLTDLFAEAYSRSPWVRRVALARRVWPNRVDVALEIRRPLAGVLTEDGVVLLDEDGVRLPGVRRRPPLGVDHPIRFLSGFRAPLPEPGGTCDPEILEGIAVARELLRMTPELSRAARIREIDLANVGGRVDPRAVEISLVTNTGVRLEWGRSTLSRWSSQEPPTAHKLELLGLAASQYPGLYGLSVVRLQYDDLYVVAAERGELVRGE